MSQNVKECETPKDLRLFYKRFEVCMHEKLRKNAIFLFVLRFEKNMAHVYYGKVLL